MKKEKNHITINVVTIFPNLIENFFNFGVIGRALKKNFWSLNIIDLKNFDPKKRVDDRPISGGSGMIIKPETLKNAIQSLNNFNNLFYLSPRGKTFNQKIAKEFIQYDEITLICGRYEGIDQRFIDAFNIQEISIGDFILCGGEIGALTIIETIVRLLPNVLKNENSAIFESFENDLLEHDHFTHPICWENKIVPEVLRSGNHKLIEQWQYQNSLENTIKKRPDLFLKHFFIKFIYILFYITLKILKPKK